MSTSPSPAIYRIFALPHVLALWLLSMQAAVDVRTEEPAESDAGRRLDYRIELTSAHRGFDGRMCWVHARAGAIPPSTAANPSDTSIVMMTMQKLLLSGSDVFYGLHTMRTDDLGRTWKGPWPQDALERRKEAEGVEVVVCDFTPKWHAASRKLLGTGHTARYRDNRLMNVRNREIAWSVYDPNRGTWAAWSTLPMPNEPRFQNAGAGSTQRTDLPNGDILLPIYFKRPDAKQYASTVVHCRFDGQTLTYVRHGDEMTVDVRRGLYEPSLTRFEGQFYLTLRNDEQGFVTSGHDGLHFASPRRWTFDDGSDLGNYNTQQHWATHSDAMFLVYTRRGADNDHVFRHRAPLFIARVDPEQLRVIRSTERVLVPERGARLGNFGIVDVSQNETWVTVTEWMQPRDVERYGSDNSVFVAKIKWNRPNRLFTDGRD